MDRVVAQLLVEMDSLSSSEGPSAKGNGNDNGNDDSNGSSSSEGVGPSQEEIRASLGIFVLGATNRPDLLDPALLRPGRFDRKIYLSVCKDAATRENILRAQTRKLDLDAGLDLAEVADILPDNLTGADISAAVSNAFTSVSVGATSIESGSSYTFFILSLRSAEIGPMCAINTPIGF